jgi:hypothetical protein
MSRARAASTSSGLARVAGALERLAEIAGDLALPTYRRQNPQPVRVPVAELGVEHIGSVVEVYRQDAAPAERTRWSTVGVLVGMQPARDLPAGFPPAAPGLEQRAYGRRLGLDVGGATPIGLDVQLDHHVIVLRRP